MVEKKNENLDIYKRCTNINEISKIENSLCKIKRIIK